MGSIGVNSGSADVDYDAVFVPTAFGTHCVWNLGIAASWAEAAWWSIELPGTRPPTASLRLRCFLLRNGHRSLPRWWSFSQSWGWLSLCCMRACLLAHPCL